MHRFIAEDQGSVYCIYYINYDNYLNFNLIPTIKHGQSLNRLATRLSNYSKKRHNCKNCVESRSNDGQSMTVSK